MFPTLSLPSERQATLRAAGFAAALLLAAVLPFELERPLLPLGPLVLTNVEACLLYTSPSPRDGLLSRMPSSA